MSQFNSKPVLMVVSFGTSYPESRELTIGAVETALQTAYPDYQVRRAFTSQVILDILKQRDGLEIDNVRQALERLVHDGVQDVVIQPTHVITGSEYHDVLEEVAEFAEKFHSVKVGRALLTLDRDYDTLISILECGMGLMLGTEMIWRRMRSYGKQIVVITPGPVPDDFLCGQPGVFPDFLLHGYSHLPGIDFWGNCPGYSPGPGSVHRV